MTTPTPEAIEYTPPVVDIQLFYSAGRLGLGVRALESRKELDRAIAAITAQAKAEAWDAVIARIDLGAPHMVDEKYVAGARWVRNQIEDVLKPTIEGKSE